MRKSLLKVLCLTLISVLLGSGVGLANPSIVTTIYPLYEFTKQVVGDKAEVLLLVPNGAEPHDWEPAPADLIKLKNASLVVGNGAGLEPWLDRVGNTVLAGKKVVNAADVVELLESADSDEEDEADDGHGHGHVDPHVWLDPVNAQAIVQAIAGAAAGIDAANSDYYYANAANYIAQLATLDNEYRTGLASATRRDIITSHAAFGYLANRYGLNQVAIMGLAPDAEPTPERMAEIIRYVRSNGIKYIFFETLVSPKLSEVIASESGAETLVLNPIEGLTDGDIARGENYLSIMRTNLMNLQHALGVN
jgi:zinc transport system substrate-binding protein